MHYAAVIEVCYPPKIKTKLWSTETLKCEDDTSFEKVYQRLPPPPPHTHTQKMKGDIPSWDQSE